MYKHKIGSRAQVMHGTAKMTGGGLTKKQLKYNKHGKIVSKKASKAAKKSKNLIKAGYITKKGVFGSVKKGGSNMSKHKFGNTSRKLFIPPDSPDSPDSPVSSVSSVLPVSPVLPVLPEQKYYESSVVSNRNNNLYLSPYPRHNKLQPFLDTLSPVKSSSIPELYPPNSSSPELKSQIFPKLLSDHNITPQELEHQILQSKKLQLNNKSLEKRNNSNNPNTLNTSNNSSENIISDAHAHSIVHKYNTECNYVRHFSVNNLEIYSFGIMLDVVHDVYNCNRYIGIPLLQMNSVNYTINRILSHIDIEKFVQYIFNVIYFIIDEKKMNYNNFINYIMKNICFDTFSRMQLSSNSILTPETTKRSTAHINTNSKQTTVEFGSNNIRKTRQYTYKFKNVYHYFNFNDKLYAEFKKYKIFNNFINNDISIFFICFLYNINKIYKRIYLKFLLDIYNVEIIPNLDNISNLIINAPFDENRYRRLFINSVKFRGINRTSEIPLNRPSKRPITRSLSSNMRQKQKPYKIKHPFGTSSYKYRKRVKRAKAISSMKETRVSRNNNLIVNEISRVCHMSQIIDAQSICAMTTRNMSSFLLNFNNGSVPCLPHISIQFNGIPIIDFSHYIICEDSNYSINKRILFFKDKFDSQSMLQSGSYTHSAKQVILHDRILSHKFIGDHLMILESILTGKVYASKDFSSFFSLFPLMYMKRNLRSSRSSRSSKNSRNSSNNSHEYLPIKFYLQHGFYQNHIYVLRPEPSVHVPDYYTEFLVQTS